MPDVLLYHPNIFICIKLLDQLLQSEICKYKPEGLALYTLLFFIIFSGSAAQRGMAMASSSTRFRDHTQRRATFGRTDLDE
jgi:hypothetical protein